MGSKYLGYINSQRGLKETIENVVVKHPYIINRRKVGHRLVVEVNVRFEKIPSELTVLLQIKRESAVRLVKSEEKFTNQHFDDLLKLPLPYKDKVFVNYFRQRNNRPMTPREWLLKGFAEKGRMNSINKICKENGLHIRFLMEDKEFRSKRWPDCKHKFYIMKEKSI